MKALGIGTRVRIGWCPTERMRGPHDPRLRTGTITDGPHTPGIYAFDGGAVLKIPHTAWTVALDGGGSASCAESLLTPIDDDDPAAVHEDEQEAVSA